MKKSIPFFMAVMFLFTACNNADNQTAHEEHQTSATDSDAHASTDESKIEAVHAVYTDLDGKVSSFMGDLADKYLVIKNALVNSDEEAAAKAAEEFNTTLKEFDKSLFTIDQKKSFDLVEPNLRSSSDAISKSKLSDQRKQFQVMSNNMYELVKSFQSGKTLYHEYCPMYEGGAMWLSDAKEIANPFYGDKMMKCGTVKEVIQ